MTFMEEEGSTEVEVLVQEDLVPPEEEEEVCLRVWRSCRSLCG